MNNSTASLFLHSVLSGGKCEAECDNGVDWEINSEKCLKTEQEEMKTRFQIQRRVARHLKILLHVGKKHFTEQTQYRGARLNLLLKGTAAGRDFYSSCLASVSGWEMYW